MCLAALEDRRRSSLEQLAAGESAEAVADQAEWICKVSGGFGVEWSGV